MFIRTCFCSWLMISSLRSLCYFKVVIDKIGRVFKSFPFLMIHNRGVVKIDLKKKWGKIMSTQYWKTQPYVSAKIQPLAIKRNLFPCTSFFIWQLQMLHLKFKNEVPFWRFLSKYIFFSNFILIYLLLWMTSTSCTSTLLYTYTN